MTITPHTDDLALLERVEAQQALHQLNALVGRALDRGDRALLAAQFSADATLDWGPCKGPASTCFDALSSPGPGLERSFHSLSNECFVVDGDRATGEVYVLGISTVVDGEKKIDRLVGGRYLDRYRCIDGQWRVTHRVFVHDWNMSVPCTAVWNEGLFAQFELRGSRDRNDPVYQLLGARP